MPVEASDHNKGGLVPKQHSHQKSLPDQNQEDRSTQTEESGPEPSEKLLENTKEQLLSGSLNDIQKHANAEDLEFMSDTSAAMLIRTPRGGRLLISVMFLAIVSAIVWANFAELDEITRGSGKIIPSSRLQIIQNLEGGILKELYVKEGQRVLAGEALLQLDDTQFKVSYREGAIEYYGSLAKSYRLKAELDGDELLFPAVLDKHESYTSREMDVYIQRAATLHGELDIVEKQSTQAYHSLTAAHAQYGFLSKSYQLGAKELKLTMPMAEQGIISQVELLQLEQKVNDLDAERRMVQLSIPKLEAAYEEIIARKEEVAMKFREEVVQELKDIEVDIEQLATIQTGMKDQVTRTLVVAPLTGIIKKIDVTTIGGIVQPGMKMMEIVPIEDSLLVEVNINPKDIGFVRYGMKAVVKLTAYDYAIYGGLEGVVEHISADTIQNKDEESFYVIRIRTKKSYLGNTSVRLKIIPGMHTSVDIITGKKTVMQYLLKPVLRAKQNALTER